MAAQPGSALQERLVAAGMGALDHMRMLVENSATSAFGRPGEEYQPMRHSSDRNAHLVAMPRCIVYSS